MSSYGMPQAGDEQGWLPPTPSFEPWIGRIQMARAWSATLGMVIITLLTANAGNAWDGAILRGLAASIVMYFVGWVSALFICGELYAVEVRRARDEAEQHETERRERITEMYQQQIAQHHAASDTGDQLPPAQSGTGSDAMATTPLQAVPSSGVSPPSAPPQFDQGRRAA